MMNTELSESLKVFTEKIVKDLGYPETEVVVTGEQTEEGYEISVAINGEGLELLIGFHGKNLQSIQSVLLSYARRLIADKELKIFLFLDIGQYFYKQNERIAKEVEQAIEEVKLLEEPYEFKPMNPRLRRYVHMEVSKHPEVRSESKGEGEDRRVVIYPAEK